MKRKQKNRTPRQKAFTLVEVLIVIVIIGIMAAIYSLSVGAAQDKAQATKIVSEMKVLKSAPPTHGVREMELIMPRESREDCPLRLVSRLL